MSLIQQISPAENSLVGRWILHPSFGEGQITRFESDSCMNTAFLSGESKLLGLKWVMEHCRFAEEEYQNYTYRR